MSVEKCQPENVDAFENCQSKGKTMRTLDEVIDKLIECHTRWCRWSETSDIVDRSAVEDAIEYLKEYREKHDDILRMEEALGYCMDNQPLTLDKGE